MQWRCQTTRSSHKLQKILIFSRMLDAAGGDAVCRKWANGAFRAGLVVFSHQTVKTKRRILKFTWPYYCYWLQVEVRRADATRLIPERSLVKERSLHTGAVSSLETCSAELWPSSSATIPSGLSNAAACAIKGAYISVPISPPNSAESGSCSRTSRGSVAASLRPM